MMPSLTDKSKEASAAREQERTEFNFEASPKITAIALRRSDALRAQNQKNLQSHQDLIAKTKAGASLIERSKVSNIISRLICESHLKC